jgi:hypothetical protein
VDARGHNVIADWLSGLDTKMCARMKAKLDVLLRAEGDLPPKMLTDTNLPQIKELRVNSKEALRLLLCRGPGQKMAEITLLFGAKERDSKYVPNNALALAEANRQLVVSAPTKYRQLRKTHANS